MQQQPQHTRSAWGSAAAEAAVRHPTLRGEAKLAYLLLWHELGGAPGTLEIHPAAVGAAQGHGELAGRRALEALAAAGLAQIVDQPKKKLPGKRAIGGAWTVYLLDAATVRTAKLAKHDAQRVLAGFAEADAELETTDRVDANLSPGGHPVALPLRTQAGLAGESSGSVDRGLAEEQASPAREGPPERGAGRVFISEVAPLPKPIRQSTLRQSQDLSLDTQTVRQFREDPTVTKGSGKSHSRFGSAATSETKTAEPSSLAGVIGRIGAGIDRQAQVEELAKDIFARLGDGRLKMCVTRRLAQAVIVGDQQGRLLSHAELNRLINYVLEKEHKRELRNPKWQVFQKIAKRKLAELGIQWRED